MGFITVGEGYKIFRALGILTTCCDMTEPEIFKHRLPDGDADYTIVKTIWTLYAKDTIKLSMKATSTVGILGILYSSLREIQMDWIVTGSSPQNIRHLIYKDNVAGEPAIFVNTTCSFPSGQIPVSKKTRDKVYEFLLELSYRADLVFCDADGNLCKGLGEFMALYDRTYDTSWKED
jgi:hypothetical protein